MTARPQNDANAASTRLHSNGALSQSHLYARIDQSSETQTIIALQAVAILYVCACMYAQCGYIDFLSNMGVNLLVIAGACRTDYFIRTDVIIGW